MRKLSDEFLERLANNEFDLSKVKIQLQVPMGLEGVIAKQKIEAPKKVKAFYCKLAKPLVDYFNSHDREYVFIQSTLQMFVELFPREIYDIENMDQVKEIYDDTPLM
jgi:hypothetical protein